MGVAAQGDGGLGADDIIAVGSPGMDTWNAGRLNINPDHVWVGAAADDSIINSFSGATLRPNPADDNFGGRNIAVDTHGHSGYWDPNSQSLLNQGRIISGKPPGVVPKNPGPDIPVDGPPPMIT